MARAETPEDPTPEQIDDTASKMAWTINDERWETASEPRRAFWREMVRESIKAAMLAGPAKKAALDKIQARIAREGLTDAKR